MDIAERITADVARQHAAWLRFIDDICADSLVRDGGGVLVDQRERTAVIDPSVPWGTIHYVN